MKYLCIQIFKNQTHLITRTFEDGRTALPLQVQVVRGQVRHDVENHSLGGDGQLIVSLRGALLYGTHSRNHDVDVNALQQSAHQRDDAALAHQFLVVSGLGQRPESSRPGAGHVQHFALVFAELVALGPKYAG